MTEIRNSGKVQNNRTQEFDKEPRKSTKGVARDSNAECYSFIVDGG